MQSWTALPGELKHGGRLQHGDGNFRDPKTSDIGRMRRKSSGGDRCRYSPEFGTPKSHNEANAVNFVTEARLPVSLMAGGFAVCIKRRDTTCAN
jgi:hypothetical protein